jgi:hypothetical protein
MIHVEIKQLAHCEQVGHLITGDRQLVCSRGVDYEKAQVAIDDATRLAYIEVLPDEKQTTALGFLLRAVAGSMVRGSTPRKPAATTARGYSPVTEAPTTQNPGEKPVQRLAHTKTHQAIQATDKRQSRAFHQDPAGGVGIVQRLSDLS